MGAIVKLLLTFGLAIGFMSQGIGDSDEDQGTPSNEAERTAAIEGDVLRGVPRCDGDQTSVSRKTIEVEDSLTFDIGDDLTKKGSVSAATDWFAFEIPWSYRDSYVLREAMVSFPKGDVAKAWLLFFDPESAAESLEASSADVIFYALPKGVDVGCGFGHTASFAFPFCASMPLGEMKATRIKALYSTTDKAAQHAVSTFLTKNLV